MLTRVQLEVALQKKKKHKNKNKKTNNGKERGNHAYWGRNSWHVASRTLVPQLLGANHGPASAPQAACVPPRNS